MRKKITILILFTMFFVFFILSANNSQAAFTTMNYIYSTNTLYNGINQILTVKLNSGTEKVYLKKLKISCQHNLASDFAITLKDSQGNILANSMAASGDFGSLNKEFTGLLELKVTAMLTGLTMPYDQNVIFCTVNNSDVELLNLANGKIHNPNVEYSTTNNVSLNITNISNPILPNTKAAEILKFNFSLDDEFILDKITMECSSPDIKNVNLVNISTQATLKTGVILNDGYINSWAKIKYVFNNLNYPVASNNLAYSIKADIPETMVSQTLKCAINSEYSAKTLSGASQAINISGAASEVKIQNNQLDITYSANNPNSSLSLKKGLKDYAVLWLNIHADSNIDLTITSATFKKYGDLNNNYISKASLYGNLRKFIQSKSVVTSDTLSFGEMNYQLKAGETHDLILEIDMADNIESNKDFYFYLTDLQAIDANGSAVKINAILPLKGNIMRVAESSIVNKPDLIISDVSYNKRTDGLYDVKAKVKNTGEAEAKGSFKVMAYQSSSHNYYQMTPADAVIAVGGYYEVSFTLEEGKYKFTADYDNVISEKDENNNYLESNIVTNTSYLDVISASANNITSNSAAIEWSGGSNLGWGKARIAKSLDALKTASYNVSDKYKITDSGSKSYVNINDLEENTKYYIEVMRAYLDSNGYDLSGKTKIVTFNTLISPTCPMPVCNVGLDPYNTGKVDASGCKVYSCPSPTCSMPVCKDGSNPYYTGKIDVNGCKIYLCPERACTSPVCQDGSNPYYTGKVDANGCKAYLCQEISSSVISEQVKCVFKGSQTEQKCYMAGYNDISCSGKESCAIDLKRAKGEKITWKSTCGGYAYTVMDGQEEYAGFDCTAAIVDMNNAAKSLNEGKISELLIEIKQLRDELREQAAELKYLKIFASEMRELNSNMQSAIKLFIAYGVDANTVKLGAGERAAVINSYKAAFAKLPETEAELTDAIKIANGRFPSLVSDAAEKTAKDQFIKIYKRIPDLNDAKDNAAIKVMAYGLRQKAENRNLNSEKSGIKIFRAIYGYTPKTTEDWNAMQAITYSGAAREKDSDGDLLSDEMEAQYGTDTNNPDTDGDGFKDGVEVNSGYNPKGEGKL